jgi:hypothetical protein
LLEKARRSLLEHGLWDPGFYTICRAWFWLENGYKSLSQTIKIIIQGFMLSPAPQA